MGVIHRDLACRNVLVDSKMVLKISDFGLARNSKEYASSMANKLPLRWMAPETFETSIFNEQSDMCVFVCVCVCVCVCVHVHVHVCLSVCVHVCMQVCGECLFVCARLCVYVCTCMRAYICM